MKRTAAAAVAGLLVVAGSLSAAPAGAGERMQLQCESGTLAGHTLERANGASWWDVGNGTVYTTKSITVSSGEDGVVYEKDYGHEARDAETCTASHFDWTWDLDLVEAAK